jgi:pimeloyl-ACP methyl ester carboxylesterase
LPAAGAAGKEDFMTAFRILGGALFLAVAARAQAPQAAPVTADQQPETQAMATAARNLARSAKVPDEIKAQADKLIGDSAALETSGQSGEARRKLANAITLLNGQSWDQKAELAWSLALRVDTPVADSTLPAIGRLSQFYPVVFKPEHGLQLKAVLVAPAAAGKTEARAPRPAGTFPIAAMNFASEALGFDANLEGAPDGAYSLKVELMDGGQAIASLQTPIQVVRGIASDRPAIERRLAKVQGHDSTKATIRYPYILATTVNTGRRHLNQADFGIPFDPHPVPYDFAEGVRHSADLLKALETGKDLLWRAKGDHARHYWFEDAHEMMPYRVYVPLKWDGRSKLPMVLCLHGSTRDENFYFDRDGGVLAKQAELHGYLVVCPLGFRPSADWGSAQMASGTPGAGQAGRGQQSNDLAAGARGNPAAAGQAGRGGGGQGGGQGGRGRVGAANSARMQENRWSEKDALNVLELVQKEYPIDEKRIYLFGHSRGGAGVWYMATQYPERWAAMANSAAGISANAYQTVPYDRLKGMPMMIEIGDQDPALNATRVSVKLAKEHGLDPVYVEVPGATHETIVAIEEPGVFDFFDKHRRP